MQSRNIGVGGISLTQICEDGMKVSFIIVVYSVCKTCSITVVKKVIATMYLLTIVLIICSLSLNYADFDLSEGDPCVANTFTGRCKFSQDCPSAVKDFLLNKLPEKICSFPNSDDIIICCPDDVTSTPVTFTSTTQRINTKPTKRVNSGVVPLNNYPRKRLALQKCEEYSKHVYKLEQPPTLLLDRQPSNISLCAITTKKLIVGGTIAEPKEFPHMVAVGFNDGSEGIKWQCGGSLVSEKFVLTAAHCTYSNNWGEPKWVRVGDSNLVKTNDDAMVQDRIIIEIINHPEYRKPAEYHDIALLRMDRKVTFDAYVRPACLPIIPDIPFGKVLATGWGLTDSDEEKGSDDLLKVTLAVVSHETCNRSYRNDRAKLNRGIVSEWQICAGELNKDTCQGDSGGPLSIYNTEYYCMYNVVGITSLGKLCASTIPGVYTKVYNYLPWLESAIWRQSDQ